MISRRIREIAKTHQSSGAVRSLIVWHARISHLFLFLATLTGYIPSHIIRSALYRRLFGVQLPSDSIIYWRCRFFEPQGVSIGHHSIIGNDAFLDGREGVSIGDNVNIAAEVRIYTVEHDIASPDFATSRASVKINNWAYIGSRVTILPGITIGDGAVVASGAVVTKDVEPWTVVGGVPAAFIKTRPIMTYTLNTKHPKLFQ